MEQQIVSAQAAAVWCGVKLFCVVVVVVVIVVFVVIVVVTVNINITHITINITTVINIVIAIVIVIVIVMSQFTGNITIAFTVIHRKPVYQITDIDRNLLFITR